MRLRVVYRDEENGRRVVCQIVDLDTGHAVQGVHAIAFTMQAGEAPRLHLDLTPAEVEMEIRVPNGEFVRPQQPLEQSANPPMTRIN